MADSALDPSLDEPRPPSASRRKTEKKKKQGRKPKSDAVEESVDQVPVVTQPPIHSVDSEEAQKAASSKKNEKIARLAMFEAKTAGEEKNKLLTADNPPINLKSFAPTAVSTHKEKDYLAGHPEESTQEEKRPPVNSHQKKSSDRSESDPKPKKPGESKKDKALDKRRDIEHQRQLANPTFEQLGLKRQRAQDSGEQDVPPGLPRPKKSKTNMNQLYDNSQEVECVDSGPISSSRTSTQSPLKGGLKHGWVQNQQQTNTKPREPETLTQDVQEPLGGVASDSEDIIQYERQALSGQRRILGSTQSQPIACVTVTRTKPQLTPKKSGLRSLPKHQSDYINAILPICKLEVCQHKTGWREWNIEDTIRVYNANLPINEGNNDPTALRLLPNESNPKRVTMEVKTIHHGISAGISRFRHSIADSGIEAAKLSIVQATLPPTPNPSSGDVRKIAHLYLREKLKDDRPQPVTSDFDDTRRFYWRSDEQSLLRKLGHPINKPDTNEGLLCSRVVLKTIASACKYTGYGSDSLSILRTKNCFGLLVLCLQAVHHGFNCLKTGTYIPPKAQQYNFSAQNWNDVHKIRNKDGQRQIYDTPRASALYEIVAGLSSAQWDQIIKGASEYTHRLVSASIPTEIIDSDKDESTEPKGYTYDPSRWRDNTRRVQDSSDIEPDITTETHPRATEPNNRDKEVSNGAVSYNIESDSESSTSSTHPRITEPNNRDKEISNGAVSYNIESDSESGTSGSSNRSSSGDMSTRSDEGPDGDGADWGGSEAGSDEN